MDDTSVPIASTIHNEQRVALSNTPATTKVVILMRWFFLSLVTLWIIAATISPLVAFCLTKNPFCLTGFTAIAPPAIILNRIAKYLFPKDERDYRIEEIRIKYGVEQRNKKHL
jgi:hypothetical protein